MDYVIPGNDDAPRAIKLVIDFLGQAAAKGAEVAETKQIERDAAEFPVKEQVDLTFIEVAGEDEGSAKRGTRRAEASGPVATKAPRKKGFDDDMSRNRARRPVNNRPKKAGQE